MKGRKKGFKKNTVEIEDKVLDPFYIVRDDKQFIVMKKESTLPEGYFQSLAYALSYISKNVLLNIEAGSKLTLSQYINTYERINNQIIEAVNL